LKALIVPYEKQHSSVTIKKQPALINCQLQPIVNFVQLSSYSLFYKYKHDTSYVDNCII